jgi:ribosome recycling factor
MGTPDATLITVQPYDVSLVGPIEKSIRASDLGLNPSNDGRVIRIPIPALTEDRRKQLAKHVHKVLEEHRTAVRNIRRDGNEFVKKALKDKAISEDEEKKVLEEIQKLTDDYIHKLEDVAKKKEQEILTV